jgi:glucose-6-phosphate dehydrogenase assembly protein OpcA
MERSVAGHVIRASTPQSIETDLSTLWRELARDAPTTARAVMSNLVAFREASPAEDADEPPALDAAEIVEVASRHPARIIVLAHARCSPEAPPAMVAAVGILTFGSGEGRHAVEQIAIRSRCAEASLPSIVRRLTFGDVPTSVWWTGDLSQSPPLTALVTMGRQLIYDSRQWVDVATGVSRVAGLLEHPHAPDLADLGWRRRAPQRHAVGHGLRGAGELLNAPTLRARVLHRPGEEALAWLLIGWLSSRLRRPSERELAVTVSEQAGGVEAMSISIDGGEATAKITATMSGRQVEVISTTDEPSFVVTVPEESDAGGVAAELQTLRRDTGLNESISAAHARLGARPGNAVTGS